MKRSKLWNYEKTPEYMSFYGFLFLSGFLFSTCEKQERYDLFFRFKVGNELLL